MESLRPELRWEPRGRSEYVVHLFAGVDEVESSERLTTPRWRPLRALRAGVTYTWQVEATEEGRTTLFPAPPQPPALFRVAAASARAELREARENFPDDTLLLAILYAKHGMVTPARETLRIYLERTKPANAQALLRSIPR